MRDSWADNTTEHPLRDATLLSEFGLGIETVDDTKKDKKQSNDDLHGTSEGEK
ncbi:hypothetical protein GS501_00115 [Saccharibacter sp. 17.LH.SD]|uniref:hypothetical protein n=1 Tax=Saccharibacter sp. 17.LH.SD TaxID=2689393 RepID=UPI00136B4BA8|nr:hypothetical protein [Saccharibacter sp. 17.LH.SD]MXV43485.1 hypothetical protein [Saccharibacter sp. 17.LH.SD]